MFILHSSNKTENLLQHLVTVLKAAPLTNPFAEEIFLIQSQGMERWLSQQLAEYFNVWGNYRYLFPGKFFGNISTRLQQEIDAANFERHLLLWRIETQLRNIADSAIYLPLQNYLSGETCEFKRFQLAKQLTQIFDQYQLLRPDLLAAWQSGQCLYAIESEAWQSQLWRDITKNLGNEHRGECWRQAINCLQQADPGEFADLLPERVSVFGINSAPPLLLGFLQALSLHCDVHLYMLNPAQAYWADIPSKRLQVELKEFQGHPLLIALGQQGREFQQILLEQVEFQFEPSSFELTSAENNLQVLQNDILANRVSQLELKVDDSIRIHACHSRLREVQVLKNELLATLENHKKLELKDIVVMAPDIQLYAPYINAVFADIQHAIADRSLRISNAAVNALLVFLDLSQSRLGWQSVIDLLEQPLVYVNFGLVAEELELLRYWINDTQVRWGSSASHKLQLGLPALSQNTWQAALDRLFMGYAVGSDAEFVDEVLPYINIEGSASLALGGLNDFLQFLFKAADELKTPKTFLEWQTLLLDYAERLLGKTDNLECQPLNELLAEMTEIASIHEQPLSLAVITAWLEGRMDESKSSQGFLRGQLTFCSMLPMRSIPFQLIALLGMNDGEFPHIEHRPSFDLLKEKPRLGDRSRRADDRYQFLEILLSARKQLIITYIGLSQRDNSCIAPSVIVSELLTVLQEQYALPNIVISHPLHAFSSRYFDKSQPQLFSYSASDLAIAKSLGDEKKPAQAWWQGELNSETSETIDITELFQFFRHPQRYFLRQQLGVFLPRLTAAAEEREPFALDTLTNYHIQQYWIAQELQANPLPVKKLQALGLWPAGNMGDLEWRRQQPEIQNFVSIIHNKALGAARPSVVIDLQLAGYRILGKLDNLYDNGCLLYRYSNIKGKDFIVAWLQHLLMNQLTAQATHLLGKDQDWVFPAAIADKQILIGLITLFLQGKQRPDIFFTEAAFCYLQQKFPETALSAVIRQVKDHFEKAYEPELAQVLANRDLNSVFNDSFAEQCQSLLIPAWRAVNAT